MNGFFSDVEGSKYHVQIDQEETGESDNIDNFEIVWLDERSRENILEDQHYSKQILSLKENCFHFFRDDLQCGEYLYKLPTDTNVILVIQEQWIDDAVNAFHCLCPIKFIFIVHPIASSIKHRNDLSEYIKVS